MANSDKEGWLIYTWKDHVRKILSTAMDCEDKEVSQNAINLVHRLGALGHLEFRDLAPKKEESEKSGI